MDLRGLCDRFFSSLVISNEATDLGFDPAGLVFGRFSSHAPRLSDALILRQN